MSTKEYQTGYWEYKVVDEPSYANIEEQQSFLNILGKEGWENYHIEFFNFNLRRFFFKRFIKTPPQKTKKVKS